MALASLAASILSRFLGDYIEGVNMRDLEISVLQGTASLQNLKIKRSVLEDLSAMPIQIKDGFIGKIDLKVPWTNLSNESAEIRISDVYLLLSAEDLHKTEAEIEESLYKSKMYQLGLASLMGFDQPDAVKAEAAKAEAASNNNNDQEKKDTKVISTNVTDVKKSENANQENTGYFETLTLKIINNLQIYVDNVHVRYEDSVSNKSEPFALGLMLQSIHIQSTDADWTPNFVVIQEAIMRKLLDLNKLSFYFDTSPQVLKASNDEEYKEKMKSFIYASQEATVSGYAKAAIQQGKIDFSRPQTDLDICIEEINGSLKEKQYARLIDLFNWVTIIMNREEHKIGKHPTTSPTQNPLIWWQHVISTIHRDNVKVEAEKWSWENIKKTVEDRDTYIQLYLKYLTSGLVLDKLSSSEKKSMERIEREASYSSLLLWRKLANAKKIEIDEKKSHEGFLKRLFDFSNKHEKIEGNALKDLYQLIGYEHESNLEPQKN